MNSKLRMKKSCSSTKLKFTNKRNAITAMMDEIREAEKRKNAVSKENYSQAREEIKDKVTEEKEIMQTEMNSKKVNIYNALENLFQKFMNDSKDKFRHYTNLLDSNTADSKAIDETMKKITRTKEKIKSLSTKIFQMEREFDEKNNQIKTEKDEIAKNLLALKDKMFRFRNKHEKKLIKLSCYTKEVVDRLTEIKTQGERILRNTELCRKLEFESEKATPFNTEPVASNFDVNRISDEYNEGERELFESCQKFEIFRNYFGKYNKVLLEKLMAEKEKQELKKENQILTKKLEEYLEGLTISNKTLNNKYNPLMTISTKAFTDFDSSGSFPPSTDATVEFRKMTLQNYRA